MRYLMTMCHMFVIVIGFFLAGFPFFFLFFFQTTATNLPEKSVYLSLRALLYMRLFEFIFTSHTQIDSYQLHDIVHQHERVDLHVTRTKLSFSR